MARQRGAALLLAMLVVTLVATFAAAAAWQQWRSSEIEIAERARLQADWILAGAGDWARLILMEDARQGGADHLNEPWAVPLMEARLSTFLAAERNISIDMGDIPEDAFLSGHITDMQGRFNLGNLLAGAQLSAPDVQALQRLFALLQLPQSQATQLAHNWLRSSKAQAQAGSDPSAAPLPQRTAQLIWLGLAPESIERAAPYLTILPERTSLNVNTASAPVLAAAADISQGEALRLVAQRDTQPFLDMQALRNAIAQRNTQAELGVSSRYFLIVGQLRIGNIAIAQQSLLQRTGLQTQLLWSQRGSFASAATKQATPRVPQ